MKYYGQYAKIGIGVDQFLHTKYFKNKTNGIFIECGATDGELDSSCKFFEESLNWHGINIEPAPDNFNELVKNRPKCININCALSNQNGTATFNHVVHPKLGKIYGNGSLKHTQRHLDLLTSKNCTFTMYTVETKTFKSLIDDHPNITNIDLFVLDVEGHELEVIQGMTDARVLPELICVEYPNCGLEALNLSLQQLGYKYDSTHFNNAHYIKVKPGRK